MNSERPHRPEHGEAPREEVFVKGSALLGIYQRLGTEHALEAQLLQAELAEDPSKDNDPAFKRRLAELMAEHKLLQRMMQEVSDVTVRDQVDQLLANIDDPTQE